MSIQDTRGLTFDEDAVRDALLRCMGAKLSLGFHDLTAVSLEFLDGEQGIRIRSRDNTHQVRTLGHDEVLALLLAYCDLNRVPLPRCAEKRIRITSAEVTMVMMHEVHQQPGKAAKTHPLAARGLAVQW